MAKKKNRYRLQPLLILKQRSKRNAEIALAKAIKKLEEARDKMKKLVKEKEDIIQKKKNCRDELQEKVAAGKAQVFDGSIRLNYLRKLDEDKKEKEKEIEKQKGVIEDCERDLKRARRDYIDASRELKVMEKHKELWQKKENKELSMEEGKEMNELGNIIHELNSRG